MKTEHNDSINYDGHRNFGLTKREYFAGLAMQGMLANSFSNGAIQPLSEATRHEIARLAMDQADALIACLNQNQRGDEGGSK